MKEKTGSIEGGEMEHYKWLKLGSTGRVVKRTNEGAWEGRVHQCKENLEIIDICTPPFWTKY